MLTGADWEWWISTSRGWLCMVFQAKRLTPDGRYHGLMQRQPNGRLQSDVLLASCISRTKKLGGVVWPLYCLYNSWKDGWPRGVPAPRGADDQLLLKDDNLPIFGCSVVGADVVRQVLASEEFRRRRTLRDTYLPFSRPWSLLFTSSEVQSIDTSDVQQRLSACLTAWRPTPPSSQRSISARSAQHRATKSRSDRTAASQSQSLAWREPKLISEPPEYIRDLLSGSPRPRRLRPLARRIAILVDQDIK